MESHVEQDFAAEKNTVWLVYILHVLGFFTGGLTSLAAIIVNYVKLSDLKSNVAISHFRWQIRTFWWSMLFGAISLVLTYFLIGLLGFVILFIWFVYRLVVGMINLNSNNGMYGVAEGA
ncbi:DUF4870 family protein [Marinobacter zhanjiangensis]|uniref:Membrane protein n=1 Tax=Marinobacter zhanjiangensis TaxID=578215 RepID=A0ABQ3AZ33_9GAMM|nr:hypothetical protein [Marinobacter zhanjiangensis]GGY71918.1 membrane protein [Marinobacter zhanjiangensis]